MKKRTALWPRLVGVLVGLAVGIYYIGFQVLGWSVNDDDYRLKVSLPRAAGLFEASEVTYRGVQVGKVERIDVRADGVEVTLRIDGDRVIPADSQARVRMLSALGENYVDLVPLGSSTGSSTNELADGDRVALDSVPVPVSQALASGTKLLGSLDSEDLDVMQTLLADAFTGVAPELRTLVRSGRELVDALIAAAPGTESLVLNGLTVLRAGNATSRELASTIESFELLSSEIALRDDDLDSLLQEGGEAADDLEELVSTQAEPFARLMDGSGEIGRAVTRNDQAIRVLFAILPRVADELSKVVRDGAITSRLTINVGQPVCSTRPLPAPAKTDGSTPRPCKAGPGLLQRGPNR